MARNIQQMIDHKPNKKPNTNLNSFARNLKQTLNNRWHVRFCPCLISPVYPFRAVHCFADSLFSVRRRYYFKRPTIPTIKSRTIHRFRTVCVWQRHFGPPPRNCVRHDNWKRVFSKLGPRKIVIVLTRFAPIL